MNTCNILFTSVGRRVSLIRYFRRALKELQLDSRIIGADASDRTPAFHITDASYLVPRVETAAYIPRLLEICAREQASIIIPLIDTELRVLAESRHQFQALGAQVIISNPEQVPSDQSSQTPLHNQGPTTGYGPRGTCLLLPGTISPLGYDTPSLERYNVHKSPYRCERSCTPIKASQRAIPNHAPVA